MRKVYLIIGASSDIGMAFLRVAADRYPDALFYAHYRTMSREFAAIKERLGERMQTIQSDLAGSEGVQPIIRSLKEIPTHILHLPAGRLVYKHLKEVESSAVEIQMRIQVYSLLGLFQYCLPMMAKQKYGRCVILVSSVTECLPPKFATEYVIVKQALLGLTQSMAVEYAPKGVFINAVSPHMVQTKFLQDMDERLVEKLAGVEPLGRFLTPEEAAAAIEFLFSGGTPVWGKNLVI